MAESINKVVYIPGILAGPQFSKSGVAKLIAPYEQNKEKSIIRLRSGGLKPKPVPPITPLGVQNAVDEQDSNVEDLNTEQDSSSDGTTDPSRVQNVVHEQDSNVQDLNSERDSSSDGTTNPTDNED